MNATTDKMTFAKVTEIHDRVYEQLREDSGEANPSSWTFYAPTLAELAEQVDSFSLVPDGGFESITPTETLGDPDAETIGWAYEVNGFNLFRITDHASEGRISDFFAACMGYDV
jgi:hypothetical protein